MKMICGVEILIMIMGLWKQLQCVKKRSKIIGLDTT